MRKSFWSLFAPFGARWEFVFLGSARVQATVRPLVPVFAQCGGKRVKKAAAADSE